MAIPAIITNNVASIGAITTTSTTVITPVLPPSDAALALTLGTPFACDDVYMYLCSIEADADSGDDDTLCSVEMDGDGGDDDSLCSVEVDGDIVMMILLINRKRNSNFINLTNI